MKQANIGLFLLCVGIEGYAMVTVTLAAVDHTVTVTIITHTVSK